MKAIGLKRASLIILVVPLAIIAGSRVCFTDSDLDLGQNFTRWIHVDCKGGTEFLGPPHGYTWSGEDETEGRLFADWRHLSDALVPELFWHTFFSFSFESYDAKKLVSFEIDNLNKLLADSIEIQVDYKDIYIARFMTNTSIYYEIFFYLNGNNPDYVLACVDYCREFKPIVYRVGRV